MVGCPLIVVRSELYLARCSPIYSEVACPIISSDLCASILDVPSLAILQSRSKGEEHDPYQSS